MSILDRLLGWLVAVAVGGYCFARAYQLATTTYQLNRVAAASAAAIAAVVLTALVERVWRWGMGVVLPRRSGHVFISYAHGPDDRSPDVRYVTKLAAFLKKAKIPVWLDTKIVTGDRWAHEISAHIESCEALVVVMTPEAARSQWVAKEIAPARERGKEILPLLLQGQPFPSLSEYNYEHIHGRDMPGRELVRRLRTLVTANPGVRR